MSAKLISWNVNGIRAITKKGDLAALVERESPDILCLQETRAERDQVELDWADYHESWYSAEKKGYSGTAIFSKFKPLKVTYGLGIPELDREGRVTCAEFEKVYVVTVYTPNAQPKLTRLDYRYEEWDPAFLAYVRELEKKKPVIFCGDLNVAHKEIDLARPEANTENAGFTKKERAGFDNIVEAGFIDTFRHFSDEPDNYTWWSYRTRARARNVGWRIDYFCTSEALKGELKGAAILADVEGSDHCPVMLEVSRDLFQ